MTKTVLPPVPITLNTIEDFAEFLVDKGLSSATIGKYTTDLKTFYNFLPSESAEKQVTETESTEDSNPTGKKLLQNFSLPSWRDHLIRANLAARTINTRIAACNNFLCFLDRADWQVSPLSLIQENSIPPVTREEYYKLLEAAYLAGNERLYFMIKTFCCLGFSMSELPNLTIEAIVAGRLQVVTRSRVKNVFIPSSLQKEFLLYAKRSGINSGSLFKSEIGEPLTRTIIIKELTELCKAAGVPEEKASPKMLQDLYFNTYSDLRSQTPSLIENAYSKIVDLEHERFGWGRIAE